MAGHSRPKDGVASLAYVPAIHPFERSWIAGSSPAMTLGIWSIGEIYRIVV
jgi:hypothetical protein